MEQGNLAQKTALQSGSQPLPPGEPGAAEADRDERSRPTADASIGRGRDIVPSSQPVPSAAPGRDLVPAPSAKVCLLSRDPELIEAVRTAGGLQHLVHPVSDWSQLLEHVKSGVFGVVVLDADLSGRKLEKQIAEVKGINRLAVVSVATSRARAEDLIGLVSARRIHRLLIKPAPLGSTRLSLESAAERHARLCASAGAEPVPVRASRTDTFLRTRSPRWTYATIAAFMVVFPVVVGGLVRLSNSNSNETGLATSSSSSAGAEEGVIASSGPVPATISRVQPDQGSNIVSSGPGSVTVSGVGVVTDEPVVATISSTERGEGPGIVPTEPGSVTVALAALEAPGGIVSDEPASATISPGELEGGVIPSSPAIGGTVATEAGSIPDAEPQPLPDPASVFAGDVNRGVDPLATSLEAAVNAPLAQPVEIGTAAFFDTVLGADPRPEEPSQQQFGTLLDSLFADAESALLDGAIERAEAAVAHIRRVQPSSERLAFLEARIAEETAAIEAESSAAAAEDAATDELVGLLAIGRSRLEQGQLISPEGESALDAFQAAAAMGIEHPELRALGADLADALAGAARSQLDLGDFLQAERLIDGIATLDPGSEMVTLLTSSLATARQTALFTDGIERMRGGQLVVPEQDSALFYLSTLRSENAGFSGLDVLWESLLDSIYENAGRAIEAEEWSEAETWVEALGTAEPDSARTDAVRDELQFGLRQAEYLSNPASPGELRVLTTGTASYPRRAHVRNVEGWVDFDFVVDTEGVPTNIAIVAAEPPGFFEEAALEALSEYRYEPFTLDGRLYERRASIRVSFAIEDDEPLLLDGSQ